MPRPRRTQAAGQTFHAMNRGAKRAAIFDESADYRAFVAVLTEALERFAVALYAYCLMWNHWHFVLSPQEDRALSRFMHWLETTHARRWQTFRKREGQGAVYQGRFKSIPVCDDEHFLWVCRYVERNPVRAGLVDSCEKWRWSSAGQRLRGDPEPRLIQWPIPVPADWIERVNTPQTEAELEAVRRAIGNGKPLGSEAWCDAIEKALRGGQEPRRRGRPAKATRQVSSKNDLRPPFTDLYK